MPGVACNMLVTCFLLSNCSSSEAECYKEWEKVFIIALLEGAFYLKTGYLSEGFLGHVSEPVCMKMGYQLPLKNVCGGADRETGFEF